MIKEKFIIPLKNQVLILFITFTIITIGLIVYNYNTIRKYENNILQIRNSSLKQFTLINEISLITGSHQNDLLHFIYSPDQNNKTFYSDRIHNRIKISNLLYKRFKSAIENIKTKENFYLLLKSREALCNRIKGVLKKREHYSLDFIDYEKSDIILLHEDYDQKLKNLNVLLAQDAHDRIVKSLNKVTDARFLNNSIVLSILFVLLIAGYYVIKMYYKLTRDYTDFQLEKAEKEKSKIEFSLINKKLELEFEKRTKELEIQNRETSLSNAELTKKSHAKDVFISVISHDLRTPLSNILFSSDILLDSLDRISTEEITQYTQIINRASKRIVIQLNELVDWAKEKKISMVFNPCKLNLHEMVNESLQILESIVEQKQIIICNDICKGIFVEADKIMLRSIIQNLVTNSLKFTPVKGKVTLSAELNNILISIKIEDSGIGMTEETERDIFSEGDLIVKENHYPKIGLGLILVKEFVEKHGGTIKVESRLSEGTRFVFTLPVAKS